MASAMRSLKSLKIKLPYKGLAENPILFLFVFCLFSLCRQYFLWISLLLCTVFWYLRTKDHSWILVVGLLLCSAVPRYSTSYPIMSHGKAVTVKNHYAVLAEGRQRVLVYTDNALAIDGEYEIHGSFEKIVPSKGIFRFDTGRWAHNMGAYYSISQDDCTLAYERPTIRHIIQKKIASIEEDTVRQQLDHILLNIASKENETDFLNDHGFSYAGMLLLWNTIFKYFIEQKKRNRLMILLTILLIVVYHAPMLLVQSLLFKLVHSWKWNTAQKTSFCLTVILFLYPGTFLSLSFLIPACYRLSFLITKKRKKTIFFLILCLQSIFLHHMNPVEMLLYPINLFAMGILWGIGILTLFLPWLPFGQFCDALNALNSWVNVFTVYGSLLGLGLPMYCLICSCFSSKKHALEIWIAALFLFQYLGLFHPFSEVTTINVGQGDSILIREPFNQGNVLIDTGKPSQWNAVNDYLHSKGITTLNTLVITHSDDDHAGNMDAVIAQYHPKQIVTSYQEEIISHQMVFYDINTIQNDDENESSIVLAMQMNGLKYLFMADADKQTEEAIALKYDSLQCDVLKLSHHGSNTGSCIRFLDMVRPQIGLISSGAYQIYHHPSPETIQQLMKRHISYFDTKETGDITILAGPGMNFLITSDGKLGIIRAR